MEEENKEILSPVLNLKACAMDVVVHSLSCVRLFLTPWTATHQASLPFTIFWSLLKFMSIESVMLSNHLTLCHTLFLTAKEGGCFPNQMLENLFCGMNEQGTNIALGVSYRMK